MGDGEKNFKEFKNENPETIEGQNPELINRHRTKKYIKARKNLASALKGGNEKGEKSARMNYLIEKAFASEIFSKQDYDFILGLEQKDLEKFISKLRKVIEKYRQKIGEDSDRLDTLEYNQSDVDALFQGNKILRFISKTRKDVDSEQIRILPDDTQTPMYEQVINNRNNDMKNIYPNREEMIKANAADAKK